jgi:hypothetical protein
VFAALYAALLKERAVANDPMLKFISQPQAYPHKREAEMRAEDFAEIADCYAPDAAADQAVFAMRRTLLFSPLPAAQSYTRLVAPHRRRAFARSL